MSREHVKRPYRMNVRAETQEQTRRRITESAVTLHGTVGPARTSMSAVAEHAGVRRSTLYRHFPDEAALFSACTAHWRAQHPVPDLDGWAAIGDLDARLEHALTELYAFYRQGEPMLTNVIRDAAVDANVQHEFAGFVEYFEAARDVLYAGRHVRGRSRTRVRAAIGHAISFTTWRSLTREQGLSDADAIDLISGAVAAATTRSP